MNTIRTRFAPSPTGFLHVGGIRTALFSYLVARQNGGQFILRLEDTDKKREVEGSAEHLVASLKTLGLEYDEGPDRPGDYGPYRQSERLEVYQRYARQLIEQGRAYADPYTPEQMQAFRDAAQAEKRPFLYRDHRPENPPTWDGHTPLRFLSQPREYQWHDAVMGDLTAHPENIDDFVLIKSDGYPTYDFAHIIDDLEMRISHVIRGQEFISSMPKYLNLYEALDFNLDNETANNESEARVPLPIFAHMPHIMNEQGNKKLGKRDGARDVLDYVRGGYLPETLVSFIATLGWNDGTEQEIFTKEELIDKFSLDRVQRSGARFDEKRLLWMNGQLIRKMNLDELYKRVTRGGAAPENVFSSTEKFSGADRAAGPVGFWPESSEKSSENYKLKVLALAQDRLKTLRDLDSLTSYFFEEPTPDLELISSNKQLRKLSQEEQIELLQAAHDTLAAIDDWTSKNIQNTLNKLLETTGQKPGVLFSLIRISTTWAPFSPQLNDTLALLGSEKSLLRIKNTIDILSNN